MAAMGFIPRTRALIDACNALPGNCNIHPLAEHHLAPRSDIDSKPLLDICLLYTSPSPRD